MRRTGAGKLIHPVVVLHNLGTAQDVNGQRIDSWQEFARPFAYVQPATGTEPLIAGQRQTLISHTVEMYPLTGITPKMRIKHGDKTLHIEEVLHDEEINRIRCLCHEAA